MINIKKIFIAGPLAIKKLDNNIINKLTDMKEKEYRILVGDANGIDKLIQTFYSNLKYDNVTVYVSGKKTRNNLFKWDTKFIDVDKGLKGFEFYSQKDKAMAHDSDYGFMIWNGKSRGTLNNMINLLSEDKIVLLYLTINKEYYLINSFQKLEEIINNCEEKTRTLYKSLLKKNNSRPKKDVAIHKENDSNFEQLSLDIFSKNNYH